jgi:hypothetical protein
MLNTKVALPRVHMAGSDAHHDAHLEVGPHGFAVFLAPDAEFPVLDAMARPNNSMPSSVNSRPLSQRHCQVEGAGGRVGG